VNPWVPPNKTHPPPKADEPDLHRAARLGDHDAIRVLVAGGENVDTLFNIRLDPGAREELATPVMVAAGSADGATVETVQLLLDLGASIAPSPSGKSALSYACEGLGWNYEPSGDSARVRALLAAGSDPNVAGYNGVPALARAAGSGDPERVRMLLQAGADPAPEVRWDYHSPLHVAASSGSVECVRALLAAGAPVRGDGLADDPILALASSAPIVVELLAAGADPRALGFKGSSIAGDVASHSRISISERVTMLRLLIDAGLEIDALAPHGTAVAGAAMIGNADAVEALLLAGADPTLEPNALQFACFAYRDDRDPDMERVIDLLVAAGLDPNDRDAAGYGPLHTALSEDTFGADYRESDGVNVAAAIALIANGASIDITFPDTGYCPLHAAAAAGSATLVESLLRHGAEPLVRAYDGSTPLDVALAVRADDCAELLGAARQPE
jgi:ankyrin repeat protein